MPEHVPQTSELHFTFTLNKLDYIHTCVTLTFIFYQGFLQHTSTNELWMFGLHFSSIKVSMQRFTSSLACSFFPKTKSTISFAYWLHFLTDRNLKADVHMPGFLPKNMSTILYWLHFSSMEISFQRCLLTPYFHPWKFHRRGYHQVLPVWICAFFFQTASQQCPFFCWLPFSTDKKITAEVYIKSCTEFFVSQIHQNNIFKTNL